MSPLGAAMIDGMSGACWGAGHWKLAHTVQNLALTQAHLLVSFTLFTAVRTSPALFASFGFHSAPRPAIIAFMLFQFISAPLEEARARPPHVPVPGYHALPDFYPNPHLCDLLLPYIRLLACSLLAQHLLAFTRHCGGMRTGAAPRVSSACAGVSVSGTKHSRANGGLKHSRANCSACCGAQVLAFFMNLVSRSFEFQADRRARPATLFVNISACGAWL